MAAKMKVGAIALFFCTAMMDQALAGFFRVTPAAPPAAVPEFDAGGGIAAVALLASVAAVLFSRSRNR